MRECKDLGNTKECKRGQRELLSEATKKVRCPYSPKIQWRYLKRPSVAAFEAPGDTCQRSAEPTIAWECS